MHDANGQKIKDGLTLSSSNVQHENGLANNLNNDRRFGRIETKPE